MRRIPFWATVEHARNTYMGVTGSAARRRLGDSQEEGGTRQPTCNRNRLKIFVSWSIPLVYDLVSGPFTAGLLLATELFCKPMLSSASHAHPGGASVCAWMGEFSSALVGPCASQPPAGSGPNPGRDRGPARGRVSGSPLATDRHRCFRRRSCCKGTGATLPCGANRRFFVKLLP